MALTSGEGFSGRPRARLRILVLGGMVVAFWVMLLAWFQAVGPQSLPSFRVWTFVVMIGVGAAAIAVGYLPWFWPLGWGSIGVAALEYLVLMPLMLGVTIAACLKIRQDPLKALTTLITVAVFVMLARAGEDPLGQAGLRFRVDSVADTYRLDAADLLASPPETLRSGGNRVVGREADGDRRVVSWVWVEGIPARNYGVVFDPDGVLEKKNARFIRDDHSWDYYTNCRRVDGPWLWCRLA